MSIVSIVFISKVSLSKIYMRFTNSTSGTRLAGRLTVPNLELTNERKEVSHPHFDSLLSLVNPKLQ